MRLQSDNRCLEKNVSIHPLLALNVRLRERISPANSTQIRIRVSPTAEVSQQKAHYLHP